MKIALKVLKWLAFSFVVLLLCFSLWNVFAKNVLKQDMPMFFGVTGAVVMSGSMEPTFSKGDYVIIQQQSQYSVGDMVVFKDGNTHTTHRIVATTEQGFITQGDANNTTDQNVGKDYVTTDKIVGKVVSIWGGFGNVLNFFHEPIGLILLFVVGCALIILPTLLSGKKEVQNEKN